MPSAAIKLPATLEKFVASQVREGTYRSREAAIVAAIQHQKRRSEQLAWLPVLPGIFRFYGFSAPMYDEARGKSSLGAEGLHKEMGPLIVEASGL